MTKYMRTKNTEVKKKFLEECLFKAHILHTVCTVGLPVLLRFLGVSCSLDDEKENSIWYPHFAKIHQQISAVKIEH